MLVFVVLDHCKVNVLLKKQFYENAMLEYP
jgi:hypothetical protein